MATIGEQIRAARKAKGMTQNDLASALNVTRTGISKWETDDRIPDAEMLLHLSEVLEYQFTRNSSDSKSVSDQETGEPVKRETPVTAAPAEQVPAAQPSSDPAPAEPPASEGNHSRRLLLYCAAALAVIILIALIIILTRPKEDPPAANPPKEATVYTDGTGKAYTPDEFEAVASSDASMAHLSFRNSLRFTGEGLEKHIFYNFDMYEENGIAFHIDRFDLVLFYTNGTVSVDSFTDQDLTDWGDSPDIPPRGSYTLTGGTDYYNGKGEVDSAGVGLKLYCTDAGNNPLVFMSFIPFPAE